MTPRVINAEGQSRSRFMGFAEQGGKQATCNIYFSMDSIISQNSLKKPNPIMCGCLIEVFERYESKNEILPCEMLYHCVDAILVLLPH